MKLSTVIPSVLLAGALALTGCGPTVSPGTSPVPGPAGTPAVTPSAATEPMAGTSESTEVDQFTADFGGTIEWDHGVKVRISPAGTDTLSEYGYVDDDTPPGAEFVVLQVDVMNDSPRPLDSSMFMTPTVSYDAEGITEVATEVYDDDVPGEITPTLMPGKTLTFKAGYLIPESSREEVYAEFSPEDYSTDTEWVEIGFWIGAVG